jgi:hypothetical protein
MPGEVTLPLRQLSAMRLCEVVAVEALTDESLYDSLAAHVEFAGRAVEFLEHSGGEIDVDSLDGFHHAAGVGEETGNVLAAIRLAGNRFGSDFLAGLKCPLHKVPFAKGFTPFE